MRATPPIQETTHEAGSSSYGLMTEQENPEEDE